MKNREIEQLVLFYTESYKKVDNHPGKKELINNDYPNPQDEIQRDEILNELLYYQAFIEAYNNARDLNSSKGFYLELKNLNKNYFNNYINVDNCIAEKARDPVIYKYEDSIGDKYKEIKPKVPIMDDYYYEDEFSKEQEPVKETKPAFDPYEYNRRMLEKERLDRLRNENNNLAQSLNDLERQKQQLEDKVKDLENRSSRDMLKKSQFRTTTAQNKSYQNEGFQQVLRTKEEQIQSLQMRVDSIQNEHQKIASQQLIEEPSSFRTPNNRSKIRSKVNNSYVKTTDRMSEPYGYTNKRYENTGSDFVDQMQNNINRLLNKSNYRSVARDQSYAY